MQGLEEGSAVVVSWPNQYQEAMKAMEGAGTDDYASTPGSVCQVCGCPSLCPNLLPKRQ